VSSGKTIGVLPLGRATFDVPFAEEMLAKAFHVIDGLGITVHGPRNLLFDADQARAALTDLKDKALDAVLLLQVTFTDASMTLEIAKTLNAPLVIWAFPEPRSGGRLRLNSFCGLNLAAHALGRADLRFGSLYGRPEGAAAGEALAAVLGASGDPYEMPRKSMKPTKAQEKIAAKVVAGLKGQTIGIVGEHPVGFDTCRYDASDLHLLTGLSVQPTTLPAFFERARAVPEATVASHRRAIAKLKGLDEVDQPQLNRSLSLYEALAGLAKDQDLASIAVRCWPETFTEYGCAICGPMGLMANDGMPTACEADVYGAVTALMMQRVANAPAWLVDIVDMDIGDQTAVFWHCGSAPESMRDPKHAAEAQIHSNRKMPLLFQFPLKPGRITIARLTQAKNKPKLVVTGGEVIRRPLSFTGTSGVVVFDAPMEDALEDLIGQGLEHHVAMTYGDHRGALTALGHQLGLEVVGLGH
jgi:L-fucose isomerase-like protein